MVASNYPEDMFALQRAKQITANPLLMQPPRTKQWLLFKPLGPRCKSPGMTLRGRYVRTWKIILWKGRLWKEEESKWFWDYKSVTQQQDLKRNRNLKRKFRAKDIDTDFRNVEFQRLVEYPGWDEQPTTEKHQTRAQERGKMELGITGISF